MNNTGSRDTLGAPALVRALLCCAFALLLPAAAAAQSAKKPVPAAAAPAAPPALTRTTTRREVRRLGFGNTLTIVGAPVGSITVEAWQRPELEITAEIELHANTEEELALLAGVNTFLLDTDATHTRIMTTGTHDRKFTKKAKNFPKNLLAMPWKIDYRLKVPAAIDLDVSSGRGAVSFAGVEGALLLNAGEGDVSFTLTGGDLTATILGGTVLFRVPAPGWRGHGVSLRLVRGTMTIALPGNFNADIDATVLRAGQIEGTHDAFAPRDDKEQTQRSWVVRAGGGGAPLKFEVGDGAIRFAQLGVEKPKP